MSGEIEGKRIKRQCQSQIRKALWVMRRTSLFTLREEDIEGLYGEKQHGMTLTGSLQRGLGPKQKDQLVTFSIFGRAREEDDMITASLEGQFVLNFFL